MKKLSILVLLTAASLFFSCSQPASSGSTNNNNSSDNSGKKSSTETTDTVTDTETNTISETDNGLTSNFTAPTLPEGGTKGPFAGKTFGDDNNRIVFGNDGTYIAYGKKEIRVNGQTQYKITQQKCNYTYKDGIMYQTLHSYNDIISERNDMMTYQDLFNYFNTFQYETFHALNPTATPAQFKAAALEALERLTNEFFVPIKMSKMSYDEINKELTGSVYYPPSESITTSQIRFKYDFSQYTSHQTHGEGMQSIGNQSNSNWKGLLPVPIKDMVVVNGLPILSITDTIITTEDLTSNATFTFNWLKTWNDGVITLTISGADSTTQEAIGNVTYTIDSQIESTIPEIQNP